MRQVFRSEELNDLFWQDGAVIAQLLDESAVQELLSFYWNDAPSFGLGFHATMFSKDTAYRARVNARVQSVLWPRLESYFADYRPIVGSFVVKEHSREATEVSVHQDWTFIDESAARSLNVWCPLVDTDRTNGGQFIFKGSHRILPTIRGPFFPNPFVAHARLVAEEFLIEVPLRAGQAIIYDHSLVHATPPNLSGKTRVAANLVLAPKEAQLVHCFLDNSGAAPRREAFAVNDDFFIDYEIGKRPTGVPALGFIEHEDPVLTVDQLLRARKSTVLHAV